MDKRGILKNIHKFKDIKPALGLNLNDFGVISRKADKNESNVSMQKYGHLWFRLTKGNALFKTYDGEYKPELKNLRMVNELLVQSLANQVGIKNASYEPAHIDGEFGLVTYNFLEKNQKLVSLNSFLLFASNYGNNLIDIADACDFYKTLGYEINKEEIIFDLFKIMVLDLLTLQTDRHAWNINFIIDETNYSVKVALLFDNEFAFSIENIFELAQNSSNSTPISMPTLLREYYKTAKSLRVNDNYHEFSIGFRKRVADLVDLAKHNKKMGLFLAKAIKNININKAIEDVEKFGLEINQEYKEYITKVFRATKHMFFEELRKPINEEDFNVYDELIK